MVYILSLLCLQYYNIIKVNTLSYIVTLVQLMFIYISPWDVKNLNNKVIFNNIISTFLLQLIRETTLLCHSSLVTCYSCPKS